MPHVAIQGNGGGRRAAEALLRGIAPTSLGASTAHESRGGVLEPLMMLLMGTGLVGLAGYAALRLRSGQVWR